MKNDGFDECEGNLLEQKDQLAAFYAYDNEELELYSHAAGYRLTLADFQDELRNKIKYGHNYTDVENCLEELQKFLFDLRMNYHLPED